MSLRLRLTVLYALLLAAGLVVFSFGVYLIARERIYNAVDSDLRDQTNIVVAALEPLEAPLTGTDITTRRTQLDDAAATGAIFQIRDTGVSVVVIEHDTKFIFTLCDDVSLLHRWRTSQSRVT